ncbi:SUKH-4 family immunity protein [Streptomyces cynarae]|uniref:SUKH-4 family immunity protein n=1 Tax=Streptomyces cynarae TaxID=2981134 RepID=A0ABY6E091_9ACTN|nr:SUKH-4 family immunity protein [Streptomyces cynarae]UXY20080.1 SUKH-4 family immunity protein [Streptomyces cynarae]
MITPTGTDPYAQASGTPCGQSVLRRAAQLVDDAERLAEELRDQMVIGTLRTVDRDLESLLLGGATGRVPTAYVSPRSPGPMDLSPLAPSLEALLRLAAVTDELTAPAGGFASHALIRPLARITRPGTGLALDLPPRLLDEEFGSAAIVRFEDVDFPRTLTHEPTRRFLREVGLPETGYWFELDTDLPLPTLAEYYADDEGVPEDDPPGDWADRVIRLGCLLEDTSLLLDGATGAVLCWSEPDATLRPLDADISTLAFTVWLAHRDRRAAEATSTV